jgi:hypothetical protein
MNDTKTKKDSIKTKEQAIDRLADQYASCVKQMEKVLPPSHQSDHQHASPCRHLRERLLWSIAEEYCPDQVDMARLYCHTRQDTKQCAMYMAQIEHCLDHHHHHG